MHVALQVVASHQLSPEAKEKAIKRREKKAAEDLKNSASERAEAQSLKRQEKQQEQMVRYAGVVCAYKPSSCLQPVLAYICKSFSEPCRMVKSCEPYEAYSIQNSVQAYRFPCSCYPYTYSTPCICWQKIALMCPAKL